MRFLVVSLLVPALWLALAFTGRRPRPYAVLLPHTEAIVNETTRTVEELARQYQPILWDQVNDEKIRSDAMWYHAVDYNDTLVVVYYPVWQDERHPNLLLHVLYKLYRIAYFGSSIDAEYIEVHIRKKDGKITRLRFDMGSTSSIWAIRLHRHAIVDLANTGYVQSVLTPRGKEISKKKVSLGTKQWLQGTHPMMTVNTWNHLYVLGKTSSHARRVVAPLRFLDNATYRKYKFARRSQGDITAR